LSFNEKGDEVWIGDKFGDVYCVKVGEKEVSKEEFKLGHLSLLTDIVNKFIKN
jgi:hypothetical protein